MFVGRQKELAELSKLLEQASENQGKVVLIEGEAGAGKTQLVNQFLEIARSKYPDLTIAIGNCMAITGEGDAFHPFRHILHQLVSTEKVGGRKHFDLIANIAPAWLSVIPGIGSLLGAIVQTGVEAQKTLDRAAETRSASREELFFQFSEMLRGIAEKNVLILFIDDLQWIDASSASLLFHTARDIPELRMLLICAYRPTEIDLASDKPHGSTRDLITEIIRYKLGVKLTVGGLSGDQIRQLLDAVFPNNRFPVKLSELLYRRSGGNPLFLTLLLEALKNQQVVQKDARGWYLVGSLERFSIPDTLQTVIKQRVDRLSEHLRDVCDVASVEGIDFTFQVVSEVLTKETQQTEIQISKQMRILEQVHRLIIERGEKSLSTQTVILIYSFAHGLLQELLYHHLPTKLRERYHALVGASLEKIYSANLDDIAPQLALHYSRGRKPKKSAEYYYRVAANSRLVSATTEAIFNLNQAIGILESLSGEESDLELLADCYQMLAHLHGTVMGHFDKGVVLYQKCLQTREGLPNQSENIVDCFHFMGVCHSAAGRYSQSREFYNEALMLLNEIESTGQVRDNYVRVPPLGNPPGLLNERRGNILRDLGATYHRERELDVAIQHYEQSLAILSGRKDEGGLSDTLYFLGLAHMNKKKYDQARFLFDQALEIRKKDRLFTHQVMLYRSMSDLAFRQGKDEEGIAFAERARALSKQYGFYFRLSEISDFLATKYLQKHRYTEAFYIYAEAALVLYLYDLGEYTKLSAKIVYKLKNLRKSGRNKLAEHFCDTLITYARDHGPTIRVAQYINEWQKEKDRMRKA